MNDKIDCTIIIPTIPSRKELLHDAIQSTIFQGAHGSGNNDDIFVQSIMESGGTLSENINRGLKRAAGKWIKILADDDELVPFAIDKMVAFAERGGYDWIYANAENFTNLPEFPPGWNKIHKSSCNGLQQMLDVNTIHGGTTLYKKSILFDIGGYDESLETAEEYDLHLKLLSHGYDFYHGYLDETVYRYRLHQDNKSMSMGSVLKAQRKSDIEKYIKTRYD